MTAHDKKRFARIALCGGGTYFEPVDCLDALCAEVAEAHVGEKWTVEIVEMTQAEVDALPEFMGH